jgi:hypothetical protein
VKLFLSYDQQVSNKLLQNLSFLGIPTDFNLVLKNYSKSFAGRYNPNNKNLILYIYKDRFCKQPMEYEELLKYIIHEATHHFQHYHSESFSRIKGVMHDREFKLLERAWVQKAINYGLLYDPEPEYKMHYQTCWVKEG